MTEEDTFRKLSRPSAREMYYLLQDLHNSYEYNISCDPAEMSKDLLTKHNWDHEEYCKLLKKNKYRVDQL